MQKGLKKRPTTALVQPYAIQNLAASYTGSG
jgi:hypothetical protein